MSFPRPLPRDPRPHRRIWASVRTALVWGIAAGAISLVAWLFARAIGIPMVVWPDGEGTEKISLSALIVLATVLLASLLAGLAVGILGKLVRRLVRWVIIGGSIATIASLTAPWRQPPEVPVSTRVVLTFIHLVVGVLVTYGLARGSWSDDRNVTQ